MKRPAFAGSTLSPIRLLPGASAHPAPFWPFMCRQARSSSSAPPSMMAAAISTPGRDIGIQPAPTARPPTVTAAGPRARQRRPARRLSAIGSKVGPVRARAPRAIQLGCTGPSGKQALQENRPFRKVEPGSVSSAGLPGRQCQRRRDTGRRQ